MKISRTEAAVMYDYSIRRTAADVTYPMQYLVIDLDVCSAELWDCPADGKATKLSAYYPSALYDFWAESMDAIQTVLGSQYQFDVKAEVLKQLERANVQLTNFFYSDRILNRTAFHFAGFKMTCSDCENCMGAVRDRLYSLLKEAEELAKKAAIDMECLRVIFIGQAFKLYLIEFWAREWLSSDPFLPDSRFANSDFELTLDEVVKAGMKYIETDHLLGHSISLMRIDTLQESEESISLAKKEQSKSEFDVPRYVGPMFISGDDQLCLHIDGKRTMVSIPYFMSANAGELIDIAIGTKDEKIGLCIKRCSLPEKVYFVGLLS